MHARTRTLIVVVLWLTALPAKAAVAQRAVNRFETGRDTVTRTAPTPIIRVGKWVALGSAVGFAAWAVSINQSADDRYHALEQSCIDTPPRCRLLEPAGTLTDPALEAEYQDILKLDRRAGRVLGAAEAAILASVVMFILDLPGSGSGEDIPYSPPRLRWGRFELSIIPR